MRDEPLCSPRRLLQALHLWLWLCAHDCWVPPSVLLRYHRRPYAHWLAQGGAPEPEPEPD